MSFTKLYLTDIAAPYTPATIRGAWDDSAGAVTRLIDPGPVGPYFTTVARAETVVTAEYDVLLYRGVSGPLDAQTISGTINLVLGISEATTSADFHWHLHVYVTQGDSDTPRGTLITDYREAAGVNEWPALTAALPTQGWALNAAQTLSSLAITAGDRLVVEIGYASRNVVTTSRTGTLVYGCNRYLSDLATTQHGEIGNGYLSFSNAIADQSAPHRVTQTVVETVAPAFGAPLRVTQIVVESLTTLEAEAVSLTTTRTDRAIFPTCATVGTDTYPDPEVSTLRLGGLGVREAGQSVLSVDDNGDVTVGELEAGDIATVDPLTVLGRSDSGAGAVEQLAIGFGLDVEDTTLVARARASGVFSYTFSTSTSAPPSNQTIRFNAGHPYTSVTTIWADFHDANSEDLYFGWMRIPVGSRLLIQDKDTHTQFAEFTVTATPVDSGTYCTLTVTHYDNGTALAAQAVLVRMITPGVATPTAHATTHQSGGTDPLTALSASILTSGTLDNARLETDVEVSQDLTVGRYVFAGEYVEVTSSNPGLGIRDTSALADARVFFLESLSGACRLGAYSDDFSTLQATPFSANRSGDLTIGRHVYGGNRIYENAQTSYFLGSWQSWTPTVQTDTGTTISATSYDTRYMRIGQTLFFMLYMSSMTIPVGGTPYIRVSAPVSLSGSSNWQIPLRTYDPTAGWMVGTAQPSGSEIHLYKIDNTTWYAGTAHCTGQGFYLIA